MFLVALNLSHAQTFEIQVFISKSLGIALGGLVAALVLCVLWPPGPKTKSF